MKRYLLLLILFGFVEVSAQDISYKYGKDRNFFCESSTRKMCGKDFPCETFGREDGIPINDFGLTLKEAIGFAGLEYEDLDYLPFESVQYQLVIGSSTSDLLSLQGNIIEEVIEDADFKKVYGVDVSGNFTVSLNVASGIYTQLVEGTGKDKGFVIEDRFQCKASKSLLD